ncbi:MAG: P-II family nitrogen regulator [Candidatus Jettenia sp. CY-1]|nr:MAG: P-II family nitrogen regulator [Candidatus Jettenia sp. CY-1]
MKKIEAVIRPERFPAISAALQEIEKSGMTVSEVRGHGSESGAVQIWRGRQYKVDLHQKLKLEIVVHDADVDQVVNMIIDGAQTGANGDGKIFISHVESAIRIRTGEAGDRAITNGRVVKLSPKEETKNNEVVEIPEKGIANKNVAYSKLQKDSHDVNNYAQP